jgi:prolipoprotein diacylglyceryltransferase
MMTFTQGRGRKALQYMARNYQLNEIKPRIFNGGAAIHGGTSGFIFLILTNNVIPAFNTGAIQ